MEPSFVLYSNITRKVEKLMNCEKCGAKREENDRFCVMCGAKIAANNKQQRAKDTSAQPNTSGVQGINTNPRTGLLSASPNSSESVVVSVPLSGINNDVLSPQGTILKFSALIARNLKGIFKDKKKLIPIVILGGLWITLILLQALGINPLPVRFAAWLTFAQGGASNNVVRMAGGVLGKGVFASCFIWILTGGYKHICSGLKILGGIHKQLSIPQLGWLLTGAGAALIIYNFMAGYSAFIKSMAGVAAFLLILRALGSNGGFIRKLTASLTAKKIDGKRIENTIPLNSILQGLALGFALSVPLSLIPWGYTPYCLGLAVLITGVIMLIVLKFNKGGADI